MPEPVNKEISDAFEKLHIIDGQPYKEKYSESSEFSIFKPLILATIDHIKDISHKRQDLDAIYNFIKKSPVSEIDKEVTKAFMAQILEQKIIVSKRSQTGKDSYRRITIINDPSTCENQHIVSTDENTKCVSQSDDPRKVSPDENTECNFSIEVNNKYQVTSETQTPLSTFPETPHISIIKDQTQQKVLRVEAELSAIKSHFKCELSTLNSKIEWLSTSLNGALKKLENHSRKWCSIVEDNLLFSRKNSSLEMI